MSTQRQEVPVAAGQNVAGILLMTLSMALFAGADGGLKLMAERYPQSVLLMVLGAGTTLVFELVSRSRGLTLFDRRGLSGAPLLRSLAETGASASMIAALALVPLTVITMVIQALPLLVTLGAVLFFGERVGWRRWSAISLGLVGVVVILRPGGEAFSATWLLALAAALAVAVRDLASRAVPRSVPTALIAGWGGMAVFLFGAVLFLATGLPLPRTEPLDALGFVAVIALDATGIFAVSAAMRMGEVAAVAPFRYTRLPFGLALGLAVFGETLDAASLAGVGIIVASGLYVFFRERRAT